MTARAVVVPGWPKPTGYANGRVGTGRALHIAGQIGWDERGSFADGLVAQFAKALDNVLEVVRAAGGEPADLAAMTVYVTDIADYRAARAQLAPVWRDRMASHYPAMALVGVTALVEPDAVVEIEAVAYLGGDA